SAFAIACSSLTVRARASLSKGLSCSCAEGDVSAIAVRTKATSRRLTVDPITNLPGMAVWRSIQPANDQADLPGPLQRPSATERQNAAPVSVQRLVRRPTPQSLTESGLSGKNLFAF